MGTRYAGSSPALTTNYSFYIPQGQNNMEHAYYWMSTLLQVIMIFILGGIYENVKKK